MTTPASYRTVARLFLAQRKAPDTRETEAALIAWVTKEKGYDPAIVWNNPFNLHGKAGDYGGLATGSGSGDNGAVATFASLADGVAATIANLRWYAAHDASAGYGPVLAAIDRGDAPGFLDALLRSKWSSGRYGGPDHNDLLPLYRQALSEAAMPTKPTAFTPAAEPVAYMGIVTSLILAGIQYFAGTGILTADQANQLSPQAATIANAVITILPVLLALITRQAVTPNGNVAPPLALSTVAFSPFDAARLGKIEAGTRRFYAAAPFEEVKRSDGASWTIGPSTLKFDAQASATNPEGHAPNGSFWRTTTTPPVLIAESAITPVAAPVTAVDIGAAPLPNNAQPPDVTYTVTVPVDAAAFTAKYGFDPQTYLDKDVTAQLRPNLSRWDVSGMDQATGDMLKRGDVTRQAAWIAYFAGKLPWSQVVGYLSNEAMLLLHGGVIDIAAIHDLGAA